MCDSCKGKPYYITTAIAYTSGKPHIGNTYEIVLADAIAKEEKRDPVMLPKFSAHNLRHTFCTRLCENESNLKVIQDIMGHKDIQTTMDIYAECTQEKKQEVVTKLTGKIVIK